MAAHAQARATDLPGDSQTGGARRAGERREIRAAVKFLLLRLKILVEPSGAVPAAAVLFRKLPAGIRSVGVVLSAGTWISRSWRSIAGRLLFWHQDGGIQHVCQSSGRKVLSLKITMCVAERKSRTGRRLSADRDLWRCGCEGR